MRCWKRDARWSWRVYGGCASTQYPALSLQRRRRETSVSGVVAASASGASRAECAQPRGANRWAIVAQSHSRKDARSHRVECCRCVPSQLPPARFQHFAFPRIPSLQLVPAQPGLVHHPPTPSGQLRVIPAQSSSPLWILLMLVLVELCQQGCIQIRSVGAQERGHANKAMARLPSALHGLPVVPEEVHMQDVAGALLQLPPQGRRIRISSPGEPAGHVSDVLRGLPAVGFWREEATPAAAESSSGMFAQESLFKARGQPRALQGLPVVADEAVVLPAATAPAATAVPVAAVPSASSLRSRRARVLAEAAGGAGKRQCTTASAASAPAKWAPASGALRRARVGSFCTGYNAAWLALEKTGLAPQCEEVFACDLDPKVRAVLRANFAGLSDKTIFADVTKLRPKEVPPHDILTAGFPCQTFSAAGLNQGSDCLRGRVVFFIIKQIRHHQPQAFVLENVAGLVHRHKHVFREVLAALRRIKAPSGKSTYTVVWRIINSLHHGLPQNRPRVYIIGLKKTEIVGEFMWPAPVPESDRESLLSLLDPTGEPELPRSASARRQLATLTSRVVAKGGVPGEDPYVGDISAGQSYGAHVAYGHSPCLTRARAANGGHWLFSHMRMMRLHEMLRLQGVPLGRLVMPSGVSDRDFGQMIGNAFDANVMARLFCRIFYALGYTNRVGDRWGDAGEHAEESGEEV